MIQPNELRIGNRYNHTKAGVITLDGEWISYFAKFPELLSGIELSEDWLKRFGFREQKIRGDVWCWRTDHFALSFHSEKDRDLYLYGYGVDSGPVKHVHQLQNLYHSLTGEELTLSDDLSDLEKFTHENIFKSLNT